MQVALGLSVALVALICGSDGARILIVPFMNQSHLVELDGVGRPLLERGHEIFILLDDTETLPKGFDSGYKVLTYQKRHNFGGLTEFDAEKQKNFIESSKEGTEDTNILFQTAKTICTNMMSDSDLFPKLRALNFDLVIVDNFFPPCFVLVPYKLGKPFVASGTVMSGWLLRLPVLPSVIAPSVGLENLGFSFCAESTIQCGLLRRFCRTLAYVLSEKFLDMFESDYLRQYVDFPSIAEVRESASLTLVNRHYLLSSAYPKLPHVEYVGGITTRPAKPLNAELQRWMDESPNVVIVSFGSRFDSLPLPIVESLFDAFSKTPYRFLFRLSKAAYNVEGASGSGSGSGSGKQLVVPSNVRLLDWLPQNDLLAHNNTRVFVTHSGNNGQFEALYHGVPMLCFYIHADQKTNALRVAKKGYGLMMNIHDFSSSQLRLNLETLVENRTIAQRIQKASRIFHSEKHPSERAADAVEHVLKYGGEHLRPHEAYKLRWWQFYMLDVFALLYVSALAVVVVAYKTSKCVLRRLCRLLRRLTLATSSSKRAAEKSKKE